MQPFLIHMKAELLGSRSCIFFCFFCFLHFFFQLTLHHHCLQLNPVGNSPYKFLSAMAGKRYFLDIE